MTDEADREGLAARIRQAREYRGFSQDQIAKQLGLSRSAVSLIESGGRRVEAIELAKLARLFECRIEDFTGLDSASPGSTESVRLVARAAADLAPEDREEVLRFAEYLRSRKAGKMQ